MTYFFSLLLGLAILLFFWITVPLVIFLTKKSSDTVKMGAILFSWLAKMAVLFAVFYFIAPMQFYDRNTLIIFLLAGSVIIFSLEIQHFAKRTK